MTATERRLIAIGLDGFEITIAERLMADGRLPALAALRERSQAYLLDHGPARETGLAWEHFATGRTPEGYARWSAVDFDPSGYRAVQAPTRARPFLERLGAEVVAFDVPYLDISRSPGLRGMANWGAHDPGVARHAQPESLADEIETRFGPYPAGRYIYGFVWPSPDKAEEMADCMIAAMVKRREVTRWLLRDRLPDWRLAITVVSELHSVAEAMWHGIDAGHPLHGQPSAPAARRGIEGVYEETDRLIAALQADHPDADLVVFSMHGMGPNKADVASMALLPEVLFRRAFGRARLHPRRDWRGQAHPPLAPGEDWSAAILDQMGDLDPRSDSSGLLAQAARQINHWRDRRAGRRPPSILTWMPAAHYAPFWPMMDAFALPSFYDGQIRLNLQGREAQGRVPVSSYGALLDELEALLRRARDPATGAAAVAAVERPLADDPFAQTETRCDLKIAWAQHCCALEVPGLGVIGPVPHRRSGGHTGAHGYALIHAPGRDFVRENMVSSFDIVPTLLDLVGLDEAPGVAGRSLARPRAEARSTHPV